MFISGRINTNTASALDIIFSWFSHKATSTDHVTDRNWHIRWTRWQTKQETLYSPLYGEYITHQQKTYRHQKQFGLQRITRICKCPTISPHIKVYMYQILILLPKCGTRKYSECFCSCNFTRFSPTNSVCEHTFSLAGRIHNYISLSR